MKPVHTDIPQPAFKSPYKEWCAYLAKKWGLADKHEMAADGITIITPENKIWTRQEVCFMDQCGVRARWLTESPAERFFLGFHPTDQDGFWYCAWCFKINGDRLIQCPECDKYFKGPRPWFPIAYECTECE